MNLHSIVTDAVSAINPHTFGTILFSQGGYDTMADGTRVPKYSDPAGPLPMQVQALTNKDIIHLQGLNVSGSTHSLYVNGRLEGLVRPYNKGGDLIRLVDGRLWLVTAVMEDWPDWSKVAIMLQNDLPAP